ncbi:MAG: PQQ-binding-like beta-propeller repeat protein [Planctomycetes bacterium]|nr:PQQ-binding-like beta-propeller repeat protein [Planctomycetota bacterium]
MSLINRKQTVVWVLGFIGVFYCGLSRADDWPTYRGSRRNCTSTETGLLDAWPEGGPKLLWEAKLEPGNSSTVIANGRVFCMGRKGEKGWNHPPANKPEGPVLLYCVDRSNGNVLWTHEMPIFLEADNSAMNTPGVDGDRVYARGGNGDVHCVSVKDGKLLWRWPKDDEVLKKHGGYKGTIYAPDVLIAADLAIFCDLGSGYNCGQTLMAVHKLTGELVWQYKRLMAPSYDTLKPELITVDDKRYLLIDNFALDIATGKEVLCWGDKALTAANSKAYTRGGETGYIGYANTVQGNMAFMNFSRASAQDPPAPEGAPKETADQSKARKPERGLLAMRFEHDKNGALAARKQWEWLGDRGSWVNSPVLGSGYLIMNLGKDGSDIVCLDSATGKECWMYRISRLPNVHCLYSEPLFADGKFFLSTTDVIMIAADPKAFRMLGRAPLRGSDRSSGGGGTYHAPALSDGQLFARNNTGSVFCFDIRKEVAEGSAKK